MSKALPEQPATYNRNELHYMQIPECCKNIIEEFKMLHNGKWQLFGGDVGKGGS